MRHLLSSILLLWAVIAHPYAKSEAFIITMEDDRVQVLSPPKWHKKMAVIINNNTLIKVVGKLATNVSGKVISYITLWPRTSRGMEVSFSKESKIVFVPMAPPLQELDLIIGNKAYEIPVRAKN